MGSLCGGSNPYTEMLEKQMNAEIQEHIKTCEKQSRNEKKLLLLGTDNSGKSTLFKDLRLIDGQRFQEREKLRSRQLIRQTMVSTMITLLQASLLHNGNQNGLSRNDIDKEEVSKHIKTLLEFSKTNFADEEEIDSTKLDQLGTAIEFLWKLSSVKSTLAQTSKCYFQDNLDYFFSKVKTIMHYDYIPNNDDILRTRNDTLGVQEMVFEKWGTIFRIYDVGGLYSECNGLTFEIFEHVDVVIYVAALNHFEYVSIEKDTKNLMHAALEMFDLVCNSKWFKSEMILFLNKDDLFREAIGTGSSLSICFNRDKSNWSGEEWNVRSDYSIKKGVSYMDDPSFLTSYNAALDFIRRQFLLLNRENKDIFVHTTCATDTQQIEIVVGDVQDFIIRSNLKKGGLIM